MDVLVATEKTVLLIQAKDSPITEATLVVRLIARRPLPQHMSRRRPPN